MLIITIWNDTNFLEESITFHAPRERNQSLSIENVLQPFKLSFKLLTMKEIAE